MARQLVAGRVGDHEQVFHSGVDARHPAVGNLNPRDHLYPIASAASGCRRTAVTPRNARCRAPPCLYQQAHIDLRTSTMSRTTSSGRVTAVDDHNLATLPRHRGLRMRHPQRASRPRCFTTITLADGSDNTRAKPRAVAVQPGIDPRQPPAQMPNHWSSPTRSTTTPANPNRPAHHGCAPGHMSTSSPGELFMSSGAQDCCNCGEHD